LVNEDYSDAFRSVERQIKVFAEMQEALAKNMDKLSPEEKVELEGYIDNQKRQCELFLKLKPKTKSVPKQEPQPKPEPKTKPKKVKEEVEEDNFDDLLG